jgi:hypothetical protein
VIAKELHDIASNYFAENGHGDRYSLQGCDITTPVN